MNIYHVTGKTELVEPNKRTRIGELAMTIEADTPEDATNAAIQRYRDCHGDQNYDWHDKPNVKFVREVSEAEMMKRRGAPQLF